MYTRLHGDIPETIIFKVIAIRNLGFDFRQYSDTLRHAV